MERKKIITYGGGGAGRVLVVVILISLHIIVVLITQLGTRVGSTTFTLEPILPQ